MSSQFIVDSFTVELGFSEKVMAGLQRLERKVLPMAERIEKKLNNAFRVDAGKLTQPGINRMLKNVERAGKQINRTLTNAFKIDNLGRSSLRSFETEGVQSARRVAREMQRAFSATRTSLPAGVNRPGRRPRLTAGDTLARNQERISELHQRQTTSAQYGNMLLRTPERATEYRARLNALHDQHAATGDFAQFRSGLRSLNFEFAQGARAASIARASSRLAATGLEAGLGRMLGAVNPLIAGFLAAQKAVEFFTESIQEGVKRTQAHTMMSTAYGGDTKAITAAVNDVVDRYGIDRAEALEQAAQLRMTLPESAFKNAEIPGLMETESVFAHQTGMSTQQQGGMNYLFAQEAAAAKGGMGNNWRQLTENMPAVIKPLLELTGKKNSAELRDLAHTMSGAEWVKLVIKAMELLNNKSRAAAKAQNSVAASLGRLSNAEKDAQEKLFDGYESGFKNLLNSMTMYLKDSQGTMTALGKVMSGAFSKIAATIYALDQLTSNISGAIGLIGFEFKDFIGEQSEPLQKAFGKLFKDIRGGLDSLFDSPLVSMIRHFAPDEKKPGKAGESHWHDMPLKWFDAVNELNPLARANKAVAKVSGDVYDVASTATKQSWGKGEKGNLSPLVKVVNALGKVASNYNSSLSPVMPSAPDSRQMLNLGMIPPAPQRLEIPPLTFNGKVRFDIPLPDGRTFTTFADVKDMLGDHHENVMTSATGLSGGWQQPGNNAGFRPSMLARQVAQ